MIMTRGFLILILFLVSGCIHIDLLPGGGKLNEATLSGEGEDKVLLIDISGMLTTGKSSGILKEPSLPARIKEELTIAEKDEHVKAIVLRINTPGGSVTASDLVYHELKVFKKKRSLPVIASIMDLGTSGGYYIAMAADQILAHPSTITGSIGVIMVTMNAEGLLEKVGVQPAAIVSGPKKAMGSPFRPMNDEERAIFQGAIDHLYEQFLAVVEEGRPGLSKEHIRTLADGRIFTADIAKDQGLVDDIGYLDEALDLAKKEAKLEAAKVVTYTRGGGTQQNIYSRFDPPQIEPIRFPQIDTQSLFNVLTGGTPQMLYMWMP
ncbi:MAG: signal peptide peptidase SppA [Nitrospirales bacterium]|nr:MAG: signal peptide peptidase SppA [Nitrospirales bacterium]